MRCLEALHLRIMRIFLILLTSFCSPLWAMQDNDPTICRPLDACQQLCAQHQGNEYADFAIPGEDCICPACNTLLMRTQARD